MQQKSSDSAPMAGTEHPPHVAACSVANWQPLFEKISIPTISLAIPNDVISYLRADFFILPAECSGPDDTFSGFDGDDGRETCDDDGTTNEAGASGSNSEDADDSDQTEPPTFPEFSELVRQAIADLGGGVFIKTNWHSPKDAFWITAGQTLRCRDISDVYQLLKASSYCKQDIGEPETSSSTSASVDVINPAVNNVRVEQFLNVRRWLEIHPGTEFRCYVRDRRLIAISPRDWPQFHAYIPTQKRDIINDIRTTFAEHIKHKFSLSDYCFDVVRDQKDHVWLMDFSPYGARWSEALAFEWPELDELYADRQASTDADDNPEFRYVSVDTGIQPSQRNNYGIPKDVIDVYRTPTESNGTGEGGSGRTTLDDLLFGQLRELSDRQGEH